ncbi:hypothetical protein [Hymenobacter nivis]|uniref:DUF4625 domain-containing protein n=1 Tax=Hymenobacter nivis TaxID=1850093 RepID=A0A502GLX7_9BACT|nr:hypothetical protein [Hymenobacter nivis]TPG62874.1 hypothetical protein EAH73_17545 [Hymenobacter nivis]
MTIRPLLSSALTLGLALLCAACDTAATQKSPPPPPPAPASSTAPGAPAPADPGALPAAAPPVDARADSSATLTVAAGDSVALLLGKVKGFGQKITVRVPVQNKRKLTATLIVKGGNIRFNQIIDPDGQANGPLGNTVAVPAPKNGTYQLIIGHNLMAEGNAEQEFQLRVVLVP